MQKNQLHLTSFWDFVKTLQTCYSVNFGNGWPSPSKVKVWICRKLSCLSACIKSTLSITSFLRYYKEIPTLLLWVYLGMPGHTPLKKPLIFFCRQKINFIIHVSLEFLQKYWKPVILGTLDIPNYTHPKWYYQLVCKTFVFFCRQKFKLHPYILLEILQIYAIKEEHSS